MSKRKEKKNRLKKISEACGYELKSSIKENFEKNDKLQKFNDEVTEKDKAAEAKILGGLRAKSAKKADIAILKATDLFMSVARRVSDDKELAALLPANLDAQDAALLEKLKLKSLASVVKARL
jgi:hypothetical protein